VNDFAPDRIPPQALDVERSVLGSILFDPSIAPKARELLDDDCFYATQNREIWSCICAMMDADTSLDIIMLADELRHRDKLEVVGAEAYLSELVSATCTALNIEGHCRILIENALLRKTIANCQNIMDRAFSEERMETVVKSVETFSNDLNNRLDEARIVEEDKVKILTLKDLEPITKTFFKEGEKAHVFELKTLPNLAEIYKPALGFLNVWTGIPSHGKTELLNQVMVDLSLNHGWRWLVFSPESYPHYYMVENLTEKVIGKGFHRGAEMMTEPELDGAINTLDEFFRVIDIGDGEFTSDDMLDLVREYTSKESIQGVVIDPMGDLEISMGKSEKQTYAIRRFLRLIRLMGRRKEFSPFIVAHTTKMQKDFKTHKYPVPTLYDIDGSAAYYNAAFQGITTYRYFKLNVIAVHVQKIKFKPSGEIGVRYLEYNRDNGTFSPYFNNPAKVEKEMVEQQEARF
jgi:replicative DNA helicase